MKESSFKKRGRPPGVKTSSGKEKVDLLNEVKTRLEADIQQLAARKDNLDMQMLDAESRLRQMQGQNKVQDKMDEHQIKEEVNKRAIALQSRERTLNTQELKLREREKTLEQNENRLGVMDDKICDANKRISDSVEVEKRANRLMDEAKIMYEDNKALSKTGHVMNENNKVLNDRLKVLEEQWMTKIGELEKKERDLDLELAKYQAKEELEAAHV